MLHMFLYPAHIRLIFNQPEVHMWKLLNSKIDLHCTFSGKIIMKQKHIKIVFHHNLMLKKNTSSVFSSSLIRMTVH